MIPLVRGELVKVRTTRTALGFGAAAVILCLLSVLVFLLAGDPSSVDTKRESLNFGGVLSVPLIIFGIVGATAEFRHRTLAASLLIGPVRAKTTAARLVAYMLTALAVGLAMLTVTLALGVPLLAGTEGPDLAAADYVQVLGGGLIAVVLSTAIGVGVGVLVRNQVAAVVGALVWLFILEPLVLALSSDTADYALLNALATTGSGGSSDSGLSFGVAVLVLAGWASVFVIAGLLVDARRDVD